MIKLQVFLFFQFYDMVTSPSPLAGITYYSSLDNFEPFQWSRDWIFSMFSTFSFQQLDRFEKQQTFVQNSYVNLADKTFVGPAETSKYIFMSRYYHIADDVFLGSFQSRIQSSPSTPLLAFECVTVIPLAGCVGIFICASNS